MVCIDQHQRASRSPGDECSGWRVTDVAQDQQRRCRHARTQRRLNLIHTLWRALPAISPRAAPIDTPSAALLLAINPRLTTDTYYSIATEYPDAPVQTCLITHAS